MPSKPLYPNESDLKVLSQRFLLWKFFSSSCYPLFGKGSFLFALELFQKYSPEDEHCFLLLFLQAIVIIMGIALINAKAKSVIIFPILLFSWGIEEDKLTDDLTCFVF